MSIQVREKVPVRSKSTHRFGAVIPDRVGTNIQDNRYTDKNFTGHYMHLSKEILIASSIE